MLRKAKKILPVLIIAILGVLIIRPGTTTKVANAINKVSDKVVEKTPTISVPHNTATPTPIVEESENDLKWADKLNINGPYDVTRVVDGDTIIVDINGTGTKIRLIGVDTPESVHSDASRNVAEGTTASDYTKALLSGAQVYLEFDAGQYDKYGRTLAYVYLADGTMVNSLLLREGMAKTMTVQPNVKYSERFLKDQSYAQEHENGFWADYFLQ